MTKFLKKTVFTLSPITLLLIAILLYVILLVVTRLPQNEPEYLSIKCVGIKFNVPGIEFGCNPPLYQVALFSVLGLIVYGPFYFIFLRIFPVETITKEWMIVAVIFSFSVYFLIDYLIKIISKVIIQKHFEKK